MSKWRKAARIDKNQREIVKRLRAFPNITVALGHDDVLIGYKGKNFWFEIKNPDKVSKKTGKAWDSAKKPSQIELEKTWCGHYRIVSSFEEIFNELMGKSK